MSKQIYFESFAITITHKEDGLKITFHFNKFYNLNRLPKYINYKK